MTMRIMTRKRYEATQKVKDRIEGAKKGKAWAREFMDYCKLRHDVEQPGRKREYKRSLQYRMTHAMHLFLKYMIEIECDNKTGKNSMIVAFAKTSDGDFVIWHNLLEREGVEMLYEQFSFATQKIKEALEESEK